MGWGWVVDGMGLGLEGMSILGWGGKMYGLVWNKKRVSAKLIVRREWAWGREFALGLV